jgi:hypothetical protein
MVARASAARACQKLLVFGGLNQPQETTSPRGRGRTAGQAERAGERVDVGDADKQMPECFCVIPLWFRSWWGVVFVARAGLAGAAAPGLCPIGDTVMLHHRRAAKVKVATGL